MKTQIIIACILLFANSMYIFAQDSMGQPKLWTGSIMKLDKVKSRWGNTAFSEEKFKNGSSNTRAGMTASLIENKKRYIGLTRKQILERLGRGDGYYFSELYPAYIIYSAKDRSESSWQILFLIDSGQKITDIVVHKNCCD